MVTEDDRCVIHGPAPLQPVSKQTLGQLIYESLQTYVNKNVAMVDVITRETISTSQILNKTCLLAEALIRSDCGRNSVVAISSENTIEFFIPIISALYIGAIMSPINYNYIGDELVHCLNISKPKFVFCSKAVHKKYVALKNDLDYLEKVIVIDSPDDGDIEAETLDSFIRSSLKGNPQQLSFRPFEFDAEEQTAFVVCSSGTTGLPKGVMLTHTNIMVRYMHTLDPRYVTPEDSTCFLGILPFFHAYGLITNLLAMVTNKTIVVLKRFEEETFLSCVREYKIPALWLAPPLLVFLAKSPLVDKYDLTCVKEIACGAAPLSKETEEAVKKRLGVKSVRQGYGLSEATLAVLMMGADEERFGSSGKVISYMSCKVRDPESGKSLGPNLVGELCFKGPMVMKGYYRNKEATRNSFTSDGWLLSGDLGYYDDDGFFFVVDRLKELIKYKGFQVAPAELEAVLLTNPKIMDAGVVGVPQEEVGELPLAFVVKNPKFSLTEKEVQRFVAERVSPQKRLRGGVIFVPTIPKNPSGKILRRELRQLLHQYANKKSKL